MRISSQYDWLNHVDGLPKMVAEGVKLGKINTTEVSGIKSNPEIMAMAKEAGVERIYTRDEVAWCAVAMVVLALRAGKKVNFSSYARLRAKSFTDFGNAVKVPMLGDVLVFFREGGHHVGLYVGEDETCYHVMGGNQSNQFNVTRILKTRMIAARRPIYNVQPAAVKRIYLKASGDISENEG